MRKLRGLDDRLDFLLALQMTHGAKTASRSERALSTPFLVGIIARLVARYTRRQVVKLRVAVDQ